MKGTIWCLIFGHKFVHNTSIDGLTKEEVKNGITLIRRLNWCIRCGLSKEDLGIASSNQTSHETFKVLYKLGKNSATHGDVPRGTTCGLCGANLVDCCWVGETKPDFYICTDCFKKFKKTELSSLSSDFKLAEQTKEELKNGYKNNG